MYEIKDSGERMQFSTGMQRDPDRSKVKYSLLYIPMLKRWAEHMTKGANKYSPHNWERASTVEELYRFMDSAFRHFIQWFDGDDDEDHASACWFNICGAEMVKKKLGKDWTSELAAYKLQLKENNDEDTENNITVCDRAESPADLICDSGVSSGYTTKEPPYSYEDAIEDLIVGDVTRELL